MSSNDAVEDTSTVSDTETRIRLTSLPPEGYLLR
jgi:hypothetical protein